MIPELTSSHEEADSKINNLLYHNPQGKQSIICISKTDVLVITFSCLEHIPESINVWLEVGLYAKNSLRYIDIRKPLNKLEKDLYRALPAFDVFTGSYYTAAFSRKGKIRPLKALKKDKTAQTVFGDMGFCDDIQEEELKVIEKFTCALYGKPKFNTVSEVRLELFLKKYQRKKKEEVVISCVKKDGRQFGSLPFSSFYKFLIIVLNFIMVILEQICWSKCKLNNSLSCNSSSSVFTYSC